MSSSSGVGKTDGAGVVDGEPLAALDGEEDGGAPTLGLTLDEGVKPGLADSDAVTETVGVGVGVAVSLTVGELETLGAVAGDSVTEGVTDIVGVGVEEMEVVGVTLLVTEMDGVTVGVMLDVGELLPVMLDVGVTLGVGLGLGGTKQALRETAPGKLVVPLPHSLHVTLTPPGE